jgi:WW domain
VLTTTDLQGEEYEEKREAARLEASAKELDGVTLKPHLICPWKGGPRPTMAERLAHDAEKRARQAQRAAAEAARREGSELTCQPRVTRRGHSAPSRGVQALLLFEKQAREKTAGRAAAAAHAAARREDPKPCAGSERIVAKLRATASSPMASPPGGQTPQERLYREAQQQQRRARELQSRATAAARAAAAAPTLEARDSRAATLHSSQRRGEVADRLYLLAQQARVRRRAAESERERAAALPLPPPPAPAVPPELSAALAERGRRARGIPPGTSIEQGLLAAGAAAQQRAAAAAARQAESAEAAATAQRALPLSRSLAAKLEARSGESPAERLTRPSGRVRAATLAAIPDTVESTFAPALAAQRTTQRLLQERYGDGTGYSAHDVPGRFQRQDAWLREVEQRREQLFQREEQLRTAELTFAPALRQCRESTAVAEARARSGLDVAQRGGAFLRQREKRRSAARAKAAEEEVADCTFAPAVTRYELPWSTRASTAAATGLGTAAAAAAAAASVVVAEAPRSPYAGKRDRAAARTMAATSTAAVVSGSHSNSTEAGGVSLHYETSSYSRKEALPSGWLAFTTAEGYRYYYSAIDGTTQWDAPAR